MRIAYSGASVPELPLEEELALAASAGYDAIEIWLPKLVSAQVSGRILLVKGLRKDIHWTFSDYRKFQAESRVVSTEPR